MKIIIRGIPPVDTTAKAECPNCKTVVEVTKDECDTYSSYQGTYLKSKEKCPVCFKHNFTFAPSDFKRNP